jgi:cytochrome c-type biogenesis protein CcmF
MASLGSFLLLASFVVCSYAAVVSVIGARRHARRLIESGIGAFYLVCALMTAASAVMINAFLTGDYSIKCVVHNSDSVQPLFYKITSAGAASAGRSCSGSSCCRSSDRRRCKSTASGIVS